MELSVLDNTLTRRKGLYGLVALPFAGITSSLSSCADNTPKSSLNFDLKSQKDNVDLYVKMVGDLAGGRTYLQYETDVTLIKSHTPPQVMYKVRGIARADWSKIGPHHYKQHGFDHGLICDGKSGLVIDRYENPISGEINEPIHYRSGPFDTDIKAENEKGEPFLKPWRQVGGALWYTESSSGARKNWLSPSEWPKASTGKDVHFGVSSSYISEVKFLNDPTITAAPVTHIWNFSMPFPPWMLLGSEPGTLVWSWVGRKIQGIENLDPYLVSEIRKRQPNYFDKGDPWVDQVNGWTQYRAERQAVLNGTENK